MAEQSQVSKSGSRSSGIWHTIFGAHGQIVVGIIFLAATVAQTLYWLAVTPPTVKAIFIVSMEALGFAAYAIIATGLGYRATERVEAQVADIDTAEEVNVGESARVRQDVS